MTRSPARTPDLAARLARYTELRRRLHAHPELGFEERETARVVQAHLESLGIPFEAGIGGTGIVATLQRGKSQRTIGLRADLDALPIQELNEFEYRSKNPGRFHGCGHDGHTTMLLAAAELLAADARFDGTVHLIFQPAEEGLGGARAMIADGLFRRFPCEQIFGMHNMPRYPAGSFAVRAGAFFAGADRFTVRLKGRGGHAAMPHLAVDPVVAAAHIITALQTLVSRNTDPLHSAVVTVGAVHAGEAHNVIPETAELRGMTRFLDPALGRALERRVREVVTGTATALGCSAEIDYESTFPVLVNHRAETALAIEAARAVAGADAVLTEAVPIMGSEDFAAMLEEVPGCYILIGNGGGEDACMVHNPRYDFNDAIIPNGAAYWVKLVETARPAG
jgi:hippurate hydrolase